MDALLNVNAETRVTLHMNADPELLIFVPGHFGGWEPHATLGERPTVDGGKMGDSYSLGPWNDEQRQYDPGYCYLFGANQGPIKKISVGTSEAKWQIVNPAIGGWVIVVPESVGTEALEWQLIGPDGASVFEHAGSDAPPRVGDRCAH